MALVFKYEDPKCNKVFINSTHLSLWSNFLTATHTGKIPGSAHESSFPVWVLRELAKKGVSMALFISILLEMFTDFRHVAIDAAVKPYIRILKLHSVQNVGCDSC